jgi:hypothetical protein
MIRNYFFTLTFIFLLGSFNVVSAQCAGPTTLTDTTGTITDGSGADNYINNQSCSWLIQPTGSSAGDSITLSFSSFELESCCDYVRVYDGTDDTGTLLGSFNGTTVPSDVTATSGAMYVTFTTDGSVVYGGFEASYTYGPAVPTPCNGLTTLTDTSGSFDDGSGADNYINGQNCSWLIQPTGSSAGDSITLSFSSFQLESCCDYVRVYDGTDDTGTLLGSFNGTTVPSDLTATSGAMYVTFTTDGSVVYGGFEASYNYEENTLSITTNENNRFVLFPNPANDILNIRGIEGATKVKVVDLIGKLVVEKTINNNNQLNVSSLNNGVYLITIETDNLKETHKFTKN